MYWNGTLPGAREQQYYYIVYLFIKRDISNTEGAGSSHRYIQNKTLFLSSSKKHLKPTKFTKATAQHLLDTQRGQKAHVP